jgi:hypothetical protein
METSLVRGFTYDILCGGQANRPVFPFPGFGFVRFFRRIPSLQPSSQTLMVGFSYNLAT